MSHRQRFFAGLVGALLALTVIPVAAKAGIITDPQDFVLEKRETQISLGEPVDIDESESAVLAAGGEYGTFSLPVSGTVRYDYAWDVLDLLNRERAKAGLPALSMDQDLLNAAVLRSAEITVLFDHDRPNGEECFTASSKMFGENIASGQLNPSTVMSAWMNSQGHRENILRSSFTTVGIGCLQVGNTYYWVQCFGSGDLASVTRPANVDKTQVVQVAPEAFGLGVYVVATSDDGSRVVDAPTKVAPNTTQRFMMVAEDSADNLWAISDPMTWGTSDASIATVDASGVAAFHSGGKVTIAATSSGGLVAAKSLDLTLLSEGDVPVYRVYNKNSGLHHYTTSEYERDQLVSLGWNDEGISFYVSTKKGTPVYRNYNPNDGNHNWTESKFEHDHLNSVGWDNEGVAWRTSESATIDVYRLYNPNSGEHVYTTSKYEYDSVVAAGWHGEGVAWKSL